MDMLHRLTIRQNLKVGGSMPWKISMAASSLAEEPISPSCSDRPVGKRQAKHACTRQGADQLSAKRCRMSQRRRPIPTPLIGYEQG
jgi:hypothetical protein